MTKYYKLHQRGQLWHYIKLLDDRSPKAVQVINFLNPTPHVDFYEFNLADPGSVIEYQAIKDTIQIEASEYERAYELATREAFDIYINGKKQ